MSRSQLTVFVARCRWGRAALHAVCLVRGRQYRWHLSGIGRELFGFRQRINANNLSTAKEFVPRNWLPSLVVAGILAGTLSAANAAESPALSLASSARVDSSGIFLHQVVSLPEVSGTPPVRLANAPAFGHFVILTRAQISQMLATTAPELARTNWAGAPAVRVVRRARVLTEGELHDLLTATLQSQSVKERGELELRFQRPWTPVSVPDEMFTIKLLDVPSGGVSPYFIARFELIAGDDRIGPWQVVAQAKVMKEILVAKSNTRRGQLLGEADLTVERRDVLSLREPLGEESLKSGGLEFVEPVSPGQPVLARSVRQRPIVQRGQLVDGRIRDGSLEISLRVEILADALPGQTVRVRNPKTRKEFYAKVQDEQTVVISL